MYVLTCFSDDNSRFEDDTKVYDYVFLSGVGINVLAHLYFLMKDSVLTVKTKIRSFFCKKKETAKAEPIATSKKYID